ncbi:MAG: TldD/PmbA family protein [Clostridia bacterium]|nr:TldD/PmbA family protein [Clostridia bacterium]
MLNDIITPFRAGFASDAHTELRLHRNTRRGVALLSGSLVSNERTEHSGVSARVYRGGVYGLAADGDASDESIAAVLKAADENARFMNSRAGRGKPALPALEGGSIDSAKPYDDVPQSVMIEFAKQLDDYIVKNCPKLTSRYVTVRCDSMEKLLRVDNGFDSHSLMPRSFIYLDFSAETDAGVTVELYDVTGGYGGFADNFTDPALLYPFVDRLYKRIMEKREGVYADAGERTCILGAEVAGILAHEAVGHTTEADLVLGGSVAGPNLHKRVASDKITLVDYAHTTPQGVAPLPIYVDDEGTPASDELIIDKGILVGYMNSRETAQHFGMTPHGNARAYSFMDEPLIRMRNTAILPGTDKLEDMIASVDDGYYFMTTNNGQADTTGEFMFGIPFGYEIKNGKLGRAILDTTITGVAFEMLKTADMVSDRMDWTCSGMCGKKQPMPVGMGGPDIRCRIMVGGR